MKRYRKLSALFFALLLPASTVSAQEQAEGGLLDLLGNLFGGADVAEVEVAEVEVAEVEVFDAMAAEQALAPAPNGPAAKQADNIDFVNQYTPELTKVLTAELHFVNKVCQPNETEFATIHRAGLLAVVATAKHYETLQRRRLSTNQWPEPFGRITEALSRQIQETMSAESAARYQQEIEARLQARRDASAGIMVTHIDSELLLTPHQYRDLTSTIKQKWNANWSDGPRLFLYPQYAMMPGNNVLSPHLSKRQLSLWSQRVNHGTVTFGWQMELGLQDIFGSGVELKPFDKPVQPPAAGTDSAAAPQDNKDA